MRLNFLASLLFLLGSGTAFGADPPAADPAALNLPAPANRTVAFDTDIRPLLAARCISCHGPDKQQSGLRLDIRADALKGGATGAVIIPGDSAHSLLVRYVSGAADIVMPPKGDRLTAEQVGLLRAWIDQGASWPEEQPSAAPTAPAPVAPEHWAYRPITKPEPPEVKTPDWTRNPIDRFVLGKLESMNIAPSPEAPPATLLRRLYLDLTGLPPTPAEVDAYLNDPSPYKYEALVSRLLASPHFGEQWGRHWLDIARYADSDGFEKDSPRPHAWRYRQWVIESLNRDLPYDQFITEQLAGDLLPNATVDQKVATGFHRNTLTNKEGGVDPEQFRVEQVVDRTNTTGAALIGLTVGCAQCHDHKYDAISQKEYYRFYAFFNTSVETDIPAPLPAEVEAFKQAKARHNGEHANLQKAIDDYKPDLATRLPQWESEQRVVPVDWTVLEPASLSSTGGATFTRKEDGSYLVGGNVAKKDTYTVVGVVPTGGITGLRLEVLPDESLPSKGSGRSDAGNFVLTEFRAQSADVSDPNTAQPLAIRQVWADGNREGFATAGLTDDKGNTGWSADPATARFVEFALQEPSGSPTGTLLTLVIDQQAGEKQTLGRFRISYTTADKNSVAFPSDVREALLTPPDQRNEAQKAKVLDHFGLSDPKMRELKSALDAHAKAAPQPPATLAQTLSESPTPPKTHILARGDFLRPGDEVQPGTPAALPPLKPRGAVADRLDLARWLAQPDNPLTSRVAVNRIWECLFDRGLVYTSDDFGVRGEPPSHPELLDWLATEFQAQGWSTKDTIRLIVTSSTYRQSSDTRPELQDSDPKNIWLARQTRFRVRGENVRDLALATSGLLNATVGGPSARPPLPPGVAELGYANQVKWAESAGEDRYRRGLYTFFQRTVPYPMLMTFDCPDTNVTCIRRTRSNTPIQALTLLNDPVFLECARAFARRVLAEAPADDAGRVTHAFRLGLGRMPLEAELQPLATFLAELRSAYEANPAECEKALAGPAPEGVPAPEAAAETALARVILNLDEFVTRE